MDYHPGDLIHGRGSRKVFKLYKTETEKSKTRFINLFSITFQRVGISGFCRPKVVGVKVALLIKYFGEFQGHLVSLLPLDFQTNPANHILSHVEHRFAFGSCQKLHRFDFLNGFHRNTLRGNQFVFW